MPSHLGKLAAERVRIIESLRRSAQTLSIDELLLVCQYIANLKAQRG